jgi:flagellin
MEVLIMVVQHNLSAMNANRMYNLTQASLSSSTEKLSSGYKINKAADDASGLSISEKMRKQIRGLTQASSNAEDGISAVQTAEGALSEVTDMLQRMNELAVKAANGTNSEDDRSYIQDEIDQLTTEIDRVAETTKFNETYLLKGDSTATKGYTFSYTMGAEDVSASVTMNEDASTDLTAAISFDDGEGSVSEQNELAKSLRDQGLTITSATINSEASFSVSLNGDAKSDFSIVSTGTDNEFEVQNSEGKKIATITLEGTDDIAGGYSTTITADSATAATSEKEIAAYYDKDGNKISANALGNYVAVDSEDNLQANGGSAKVYDALGNETTIETDDDKKVINFVQDKTAALKMSFQVGADTSSANKISLNIDAMSSKGLGINALRVDGSDSTNADNAVSAIEEAIQKVSTQRSALGAIQNRLEHTINNLDNVVENTTSAESQIRDTDMATEMVKYSNANILSQAGQSMLAQANQSNQGVLSLLG